jgi:hypothetical protein
MRSTTFLFASMFLCAPAARADEVAPAASAPASAPAHEATCDDRLDEDGDGLADCADADCRESPACRADGGPEESDLRCSDWIDNDKDGAVDCDDSSCLAAHVTVCRGSWEGPVEGTGAVAQVTQPGLDGQEHPGPGDVIPDLGEGMSVEDLVGRGSDKDGERNDEVCSDGLDNDEDGRVDCADFGCRFDPTVTICRGVPDLRFSVVAEVAQSYTQDIRHDAAVNEDGESVDVTKGTWDTRFTALQLRAFGPLPLIEDSFFLLSMRAEKTPRLTFAMFSIPLYKGHFININSGGGGLSQALILSRSKQLLNEHPFYLYNAFEQGNGASLEFSGPIPMTGGRLAYRAFAAGGTGRFSGNVGGRFLPTDENEYTWATGGQLHINLVGRYSRYDTPFLYTPVPLTVALLVGGKYDQRTVEKFPSINTNLAVRYWRAVLFAENYTRKVLDGGTWQTAYNVAGGFLVVPKWVMVAADGGQFIGDAGGDGPHPQDEWEARAAAHVYVWRNTGVLSFVFRNHHTGASGNDPETTERSFQLIAQYRF